MPTASISTIIGASIAIVASILNAVGYTLQKQGHNKLKAANRSNRSLGLKQKKILQEKTWCVGFSIFLLGGIANAMALYYAPQSLVLPLSAVTLVVNTILATRILGEPFDKSSYIGIALVIIGSTMAVVFGPRTGGEHNNIDQLKLRWSNSGFMLFFVVLSGVTVIDYIGIKYYERKNDLDETVEKKEVKYGRTFLLLSYGFMNGYFGSNAFLFLKAFTEFIGSSFSSMHDAEMALKSWYSYFIFFIVIVSNLLYIMWQQRGLSYFPSVYVIPINQVALIVIGTVLGGVYFDEFISFSALYATLFVIAILLTSLGVIVLAAGHTMFKEMGIATPLSVATSEEIVNASLSSAMTNGDGSSGQLRDETGELEPALSERGVSVSDYHTTNDYLYIYA